MPSHEPQSREGLLRLRRRDEPNLGRLGRVSGFLSSRGGHGIEGLGFLGLGVRVFGV